ncbi:phage coat protein [Paraclostridium sordellii]|uniref:phage coat protein n=1 Tax=Paraclostridium sordellii TaxID=1505 RepID=UPI000C7629AC|nr:phage coat protein [Paeniclostridium sordellii]AUN14051.1 phage coat protein [Paeniclostridium sordellii]MDU5019077.1 phage coat protein [Clostridiales bacterium]
MPSFDEKIFNGEVFGQYMNTVPNLNRNELIKSKAIRQRQDIANLFSAQVGGNYATIPITGRIGGKAQNYDGKTSAEAQKLKTFSHSRVVVGRQAAWVETDFSYDITGGKDFMEQVGDQVAEYWDDVDQATLLSILKGIFSMTGKENLKFVNEHTYDITASKNKEEQVFTATTLNTAIQKALGDNKAKFSISIMHSAVSTNLENLKLISYMKYTDGQGIERDLTLGTLNGRVVLIDDNMPVEHVEAKGTEGQSDYVPAYNKYTTYVLGDGAFEFTDCGAKVPNEMARDPKTNGGETTLYSRQRKVLSPFGISFTKASMASLSPTDEELEMGANWELCNNQGKTKEYIDHRLVPIARVITRG